MCFFNGRMQETRGHCLRGYAVDHHVHSSFSVYDTRSKSMSGPLSIISLGLRVCHEVSSYCQAWRGYNYNIQNIASKEDGLRMPWIRSYEPLPFETLKELYQAGFREVDSPNAVDVSPLMIVQNGSRLF